LSRVLLFTSLILAAATLASQSAYCLAQQAVQDSVETSTQHVDETDDFDDVPHIQNQLSFGMAYQIAPDAFPELNRILHLLEPLLPDLVQAEAVCREALAKHQSEECELMLSAILSDREKNAEALRLLTGIIDRDGSNWQALVALHWHLRILFHSRNDAAAQPDLRRQGSAARMRQSGNARPD